MKNFKTHLFTLFFTSFLSIVISQNIELKTPFQEAAFDQGNSLVYFLWESNNNSSVYELDLSTDNFSSFSSIITNNNFNEINSNSLLTQKYYWRVRQGSDTSIIRSFTVFSLSSIGNIIYHSNAQSGVTLNGDKVSEIQNQISSSYIATQTNSNLQANIISNSINGNSIFEFGKNNSVSYFDFNSTLEIPDTNFTVITSLKNNTPLNNLNVLLYGKDTSSISQLYSGGVIGGGILIGGAKTPDYILKNASPNSDWGIYTFGYNKLAINSQNYAPNASGGSNIISSLFFDHIGARVGIAGLNFKGYLGDLIIYNSILSDSSQLLVENFLKTKYIPYPNLGKDSVVCSNFHKIGFKKDHGYKSILWSTGQTNIDSIIISTSGKYWVTIENFGLSFTDTINLELGFKPDLNYNSDTILCFDESLVLSFNSTGPFEYTWSNGFTSDSLDIINSGVYFIAQNDTAKNCIINSESISVFIDSFSINSTLGADRPFCLGSELTFSSDQQNNEPYQYFNWSTGDSTESIVLNTPGDSIIYIEVEDAFGCIFEDTILAEVNSTLVPSIDFISDTVCFGVASNFMSTSSANGVDVINNYQWTFPDNSNSFGISTSYNHFEENSFNVMLSITTDSSCENSITLPVYLNSLPNVNFDNAILCAGDSISLNSLSSVVLPDSLIAYEWYLNNSFVSDSSTSYIKFENTGLSNVKLISSSKFGCIDSITKQIEVFPELNADFSFKNNCVGDSVIFKDETTSFSVVEWNWDFGGIQSSSLENPKMIFNTVGNLQVNLNIENAIGCQNTVSKNVFITAQPEASFIYNKACENDVSLFYNNSIVLNDSITSLDWKIGAELYSGDSVNHLFPGLLIYLASLEVQTDNGCNDDTTTLISVSEKPSPDFEFSPDYGTAPLEVEFNNLTSGTNTYSWNFDDTSGLSNDVNPIHTYVENGIYNITLTATNSDNCSQSIDKELAVIPSDLDIELSKLELDIQENTNGSFSIKPNLQISNVGTRQILNADFVLSIDQDTKIAQQWQQTLNIGASTLYTFGAYYLVNNIDNSKYICVEAINVNDGTEVNFANNKTCRLLDGIIQFSSPYPNPGEDLVQLDIITQDNGACQLQVFSLNGKSMTENQNIDLKKGYNNIAINTSTYLSGKYVIIVNYLDEKYSKSFVIK